MPALTIDKTADPLTYDEVGDVISYSYLVTNTGNLTLYDVYVTDDKATTSPATVATLAPGASTTFTASYTISQADLDAGSVTNTAYASDGTTSSDPDSETVNAVPMPALTIDKTADPTLYEVAGDVITYTFLVENTGNVTLTGVVVTDPMFPTLVCGPVTLAPGATTSCTATYAITQDDVDAGKVDNTATATGYFGDDPYTDTDDETVTLKNLPPTIVCPEPVVQVCDPYVSELEAMISDPNNNIASLTWTMIGATIDASPTTGINHLFDYQFNVGVTTITYTVTDKFGLFDQCSFTVEILPCEGGNYCTYTQGFYGNMGGLTCEGMTALDLMTIAFWDGSGYIESVSFGEGDKIFELFYADITNGSIFNMLPGGGRSTALGGYATYSDPGTWKYVPLSTKKKSLGTIENNLLAQTITLWFNLRNDYALGSLSIDDRYIITADGEACGSDIPVPDTKQYFKVPQSILDYFGGSFTVNQLFELANEVLGGTNKAVPAGDVTEAISTINEAFDECRVLIGFTDVIPFDEVTTSLTLKSASIELKIYPNPFTVYSTFEMKAVKDTRVRLDIFNNAGSLINVLCDEQMYEGDIKTVIVDGSGYMSGEYIYRVSTDDGALSGKIVKSR
jgi:uncharacterized repeat protein (TIGR01451 family)